MNSLGSQSLGQEASKYSGKTHLNQGAIPLEIYFEKIVLHLMYLVRKAVVREERVNCRRGGTLNLFKKKLPVT